MDKCSVKVKSTGQVCMKMTDEIWDHQDIVDDVNRVWTELNTDLEMTGQAICEDHMNVCPEV